MDACSVCRDNVLWGGVYIAGCGAKEYCPYSGFAADEPGIGVFCTGRLDTVRTAFVKKGIGWVCIGVWGNCAGTASGKKRNGKNTRKLIV